MTGVKMRLQLVVGWIGQSPSVPLELGGAKIDQSNQLRRGGTFFSSTAAPF